MQTLPIHWSRYAAYPLASFFLIGLFFVDPLSSSAKSIFVIGSVISILMTKDLRLQIIKLQEHAWFFLSIGLFIVALIGSFYSPASFAEKWLVLEKYIKFLILPILAIGFTDKRTRDYAIYAFIAGMLLTCLLSIIEAQGYLISGLGKADAIFRNHIMTGIMMSFAAYISCYQAYLQKGKYRFIWAVLSLLFSYQVLFISAGRTGYILFFILFLTLALQLFTKKQAFLALALVSAVFLLCYKLSPTMKMGLQLARSEVHFYHVYKNTSIGYRLQFHEFAKAIFLQHPIRGNGTGSFTYYYRVEKPVPTWDRRLLEPHSQYWLIATEFGLIGLAIFALFYLNLVRESLNLGQLKPIALGLLVIFAIGNLSDSLLFYSGTGYFFIGFIALCLGERISKR